MEYFRLVLNINVNGSSVPSAMCYDTIQIYCPHEETNVLSSNDYDNSRFCQLLSRWSKYDESHHDDEHKQKVYQESNDELRENEIKDERW